MTDVVEIQSKEEFYDLLDNYHEVVVKFWSTTCGPCRALAPHFEKAAEKVDIPMVAVEIYSQMWAMGDFGIQSVPQVIKFSGPDQRVDLKGRTVVQLLSEIND